MSSSSGQEYPEQSYYPSAKVTLIVRFDELDDGKAKSIAVESVKRSPIKMRGIKDTKSANTVAEISDNGETKLLIKPPIGDSTPHDADSSRDGYTHAIHGIIPKTASWSQNGSRTPNTLSVTFPFVDVPFDPRAVRSCAIVFYLGTVSAADYTSGIDGRQRRPGEYMNLIPDTWNDDTGIERSNRRFDGWVDKWTVKWNDGEPSVSLECRDNSCLLLDQDAPPKLVLGMKEPIDKAIATYLANFPQFGGLTVQYLPAGEAAPVLETSLSKTAFRPKLGPPAAKGGGGSSSGSKLAVIDYLTDVCASIGHLIRLEGRNLIIQRVRTSTSSSAAPRPDDPFKGRNGSDKRLFIYGRNLQEMEISKTFAKKVPTNIEVRCYLPERKKVLVSHYPVSEKNKSQKITSPKPGDSSPDEKWIVFRVSGIKDEKVLRLVAQSVFEQIGRNEIQVGLKTRNLATFGGGNSDPDLLEMKPTDVFDLLVNRTEDEFNSMTRIENLMLAQARAIQFMKALGYEGAMADTYAKVYADKGFQTSFRAKSIVMNWSIDDGISIDVVGINFIEVRSDRILPSGEEKK